MDKETISRICPVCGTRYCASIKRLRWGRETTCSRPCSYAFRAHGLKKEVALICAVCGAEFSRTPAQIKGKYGAQFCSPACHYAGRATGATKRIVTAPYVISEGAREAWRIGAQKTAAKRRAANNYTHSEAARAKLSEAAARAIAERRSFVPSKLEGKVADEMTRQGIRFIPQVALRDELGRFAFVVDFWLPDLASALEVNGTYWHADPRVYSVPRGSVQERCVAKYNRKVKALKALGIPVAEVWELDAKADITQAVRKAHAHLAAG